MIITHFLSSSNFNDIHEIIKKIMNIIIPILIIIATAIATVMTIIILISGMKDVHGLERKEKIKRLIWVWTCYGGVFVASTVIICIMNLMQNF